MNVDDLPDLESGVDFSLKTQNAFYGQYLIEGDLSVYSCLSYNGRYRYLFAEGMRKGKGEEPLRFLLTVAFEPPEMNSFGVAAHQVYLGYAHTTPIMRAGDWTYYAKPESELIEHRRRELSTEIYLNVSDYVARLPVNNLLMYPEKMMILRKTHDPDVLQPVSDHTLSEKHVGELSCSRDHLQLDQMPPIKPPSLDDMKSAIPKDSMSLKQRKSDAVIIMKIYLEDAQSLKELENLLDRLKQDPDFRFLREERHFFRMETYANTATWYKIVGMIQDKAFEMVSRESHLSHDEIQTAYRLFDEQGSRSASSVSPYRIKFDRLLLQRLSPAPPSLPRSSSTK